MTRELLAAVAILAAWPTKPRGARGEDFAGGFRNVDFNLALTVKILPQLTIASQLFFAELGTPATGIDWSTDPPPFPRTRSTARESPARFFRTQVDARLRFVWRRSSPSARSSVSKDRRPGIKS